MTTVHIENTVHDFAAWKTVFDKFERFRVEKGMRGYRMSRLVEDPNHVTIDLDFDSVETATAFRSALERIWSTPQSQAQLAAHGTLRLYDVVEERTIRA